MIRPGPQLVATACVALASLCITPALAEDVTPTEWLDRMATAVRSTNYEGTVIRMQGSKVEALKVVHLISDGVVREKVIMQDGNGLEIIRNGNEVRSILPDKQSVLVEEWNDQGTLFSTLPTSDVQLGSQYELSMVREERVAGHKTVMLAIRPIDDYRFGHRIWLGVETGFPLQTKLIDAEGQAIEQVRFAEVSLNQEINDNAFAPSTSIDDYQLFTQPKRKITNAVASSWQCDDMPAGFRAVATHEENLAGRDTKVTHIMYSDGLANVSVFIEPAGNKKIAKRSRVGASNSYSAVLDGFRVTVVGEVPAATVEQIAKSMRPN